MGDVNWTMVLSASLLAAILSLLTSVAGLPEVDKDSDGTIVVNNNDPTKDVYTLEYNGDINEIAGKDSVTFKVKK